MPDFLNDAIGRFATSLSGLRICSLSAVIVLVLCSTTAAHECRNEDLRSQFGEADMIRAEIACEVAWMKAENAMIKRFADWAEHLASIAEVNPEEALQQRLPMYECLASPLAPICEHLTETFQPDAEYRPIKTP